MLIHKHFIDTYHKLIQKTLDKLREIPSSNEEFQKDKKDLRRFRSETEFVKKEAEKINDHIKSELNHLKIVQEKLPSDKDSNDLIIIRKQLEGHFEKLEKHLNQTLAALDITLNEKQFIKDIETLEEKISNLEKTIQLIQISSKSYARLFGMQTDHYRNKIRLMHKEAKEAHKIQSSFQSWLE